MDGTLLQISVYWFDHVSPCRPLVIVYRWGKKERRYKNVSRSSMRRLAIAIDNRRNAKPYRGKAIPLSDGWIWQAF